MVRRLRQTGLSPLLNALLGFRGSFGSLAEAAKVARRFFPFDHDHPDETRLSLALADLTRESDYPVLYQLAPVAHSLRRVFDLGGATGNLFYSYDRHLHFSSELVWTVCDLPPQRNAGLAFARERGEKRIRFTDKLEDGEGADLFLVSGALHYFRGATAPAPAPVQTPATACDREPLTLLPRGRALHCSRRPHPLGGLQAA
jgi:putative methyltransferase (TIGR04325 family)